MAVQTPAQTPEGPVPFHFPLPLTRVNCPVPTAWRGPATPLILVAPEPEMTGQGNYKVSERVQNLIKRFA